MNSFKSIFFLLAITFLSLSTNAQDWEAYEWEYYNLQFELPEAFAITDNTEDGIEASKDGIEFGIYPINDSDLDGLGLAGFVIRMAKDNFNLSEIEEMETLDFEDMEGGFIVGTKDKMSFWILGIKDKENGNKYYAYIGYEKEKELEVTEDAMKIFLSFDLLD